MAACMGERTETYLISRSSLSPQSRPFCEMDPSDPTLCGIRIIEAARSQNLPAGTLVPRPGGEPGRSQPGNSLVMSRRCILVWSF